VSPPRPDSTEVEAKVESLASVRAFVENACRRAGADARSCFDLKLAVDEACTNIIEHGYAGRPGGTIAVACEPTEDGLRVTIVDFGRGFAPSAVPAADVVSDWKERPLGGLGWHLIRSSVDEVDYVPDPASGNRLTLVKRSRT
jgi:anti-sigma regulatory factor (Ser/Thr protein kinase)